MVPMKDIFLHTEMLGKQGPKILLLHGWGQDLTQLKPLGELLSTSMRVFLVDLPGFGKSSAPSTVWSSFDYADFIVSYLNKNQIEKAHILGHSFGGKVALSMAIRYSERVDSLVLASPSGLKRSRSFFQKCRFRAIQSGSFFFKQIDRWTGSQLFSNYFAPYFGSADYKNAGAMRSILVRSVNEDLFPHLKEVKAKTLLLWGEKDTETPIEMGLRMQKAIPFSNLVQFSQHGHQLFQDTGGNHLSAYHIQRFLQ